MAMLSTKDLSIDGVRTPYLEAGPSGNSEAVVFVHGNPGSGEDWRLLMKQVGAFARALAPHMPGFGRSDQPAGFDYTVRGYARHLGALLTQLRVTRAHLVLHDFGGPWGLNWAAARLDWDNMQGRSMHSLLLMRTGVMSDGYTNMGNGYEIEGDLDRAETMHQKALVIYEAVDSKEGIAANYGNLANIYQVRGDLDRAEKMYHKALKIYEAMGHKEGMASTYGNLGVIYKKRGDLGKAETMHQKALEIDKLMSNKWSMARDYGNLGNVYSDRGKLDQAKTMYRKALALFKAIGAQPDVAQVRALLRDLPKRNP